MKRAVIACCLALVCGGVSATDWNDYAYEEELDEDEAVKISRVGFRDRHMAKEFCKKMGLTLASPDQIKLLAYSADSKVHEAVHFSVGAEGAKIEGIWGWLAEDLVSDPKVDIVVMRHDMNYEPSVDSLVDLNQALMEDGITPYKLPAICTEP